MSKMRTLVSFLLVGLLTAACAGTPVESAPGNEAEPSLVPATTTPATPVDPTPTQAGPQPDRTATVLLALEAQARLELAQRFGLSEETVAVVSAEEVEWPDAALGCPQPGMAYAQVVTPGFRLTLEAAGQAYFVHADLRGNAVLCSDEAVPLSPVFPVVPGEIDDGSPWLPVE
jgi:hypothetical protein